MTHRDRACLVARLMRSRRNLDRLKRKGMGNTMGALQIAWHIHDLEVYLDEVR